MHTPSRPLVATVIALLLAIPAFAQITLSLANPDFESAVSAGFPTTAGIWQGDLNTAVTAQTGVTPLAGSKMLSFEKMSPDGSLAGTGSDTLQLVDLSAYAGSIAAGNFTVTLSAYFNRSDTTYNEFQTRIVSFSGSMANFQTDFQAPTYTANQFSSLNPDTNTATWELSSVTLTLPTSTTYIAVFVSAISPGNIFNYPTGYYADNLTLTAIPEPSTYAAFAGLGALGLAVWRRRQARAAV